MEIVSVQKLQKSLRFVISKCTVCLVKSQKISQTTRDKFSYMTRFAITLHNSISINAKYNPLEPLNPQPFNNAQALKTHNPENWIIYKPFKQAAIIQRPLKLSENFKDHCTHH